MNIEFGLPCYTIDDLGIEKIEKIYAFANEVEADTYDRMKQPLKERVERIANGKKAEEVVAMYFKEVYDINCPVDYNIYPGTTNCDECDIEINGITIDIKASRDTKDEGVVKCRSYFNFPVPTDQHIKDVTISVIYNKDCSRFYIVGWIDKRTYETRATIGRLSVGNNQWKDFYKYRLSKCRALSSLSDWLCITPSRNIA